MSFILFAITKVQNNYQICKFLTKFFRENHKFFFSKKGHPKRMPQTAASSHSKLPV